MRRYADSNVFVYKTIRIAFPHGKRRDLNYRCADVRRARPMTRNAATIPAPLSKCAATGAENGLARRCFVRCGENTHAPVHTGGRTASWVVKDRLPGHGNRCARSAWTCYEREGVFSYSLLFLILGVTAHVMILALEKTPAFRFGLLIDQTITTRFRTLFYFSVVRNASRWLATASCLDASMVCDMRVCAVCGPRAGSRWMHCRPGTGCS